MLLAVIFIQLTVAGYKVYCGVGSSLPGPGYGTYCRARLVVVTVRDLWCQRFPSRDTNGGTHAACFGVHPILLGILPSAPSSVAT